MRLKVITDPDGTKEQKGKSRMSAIAGQSNLAFPEALAVLMKEVGLSYRQLARKTKDVDPSGKGLTHATINMAVNRHDKITPRAIELIAKACGVPPSYFAEYRLAELRDLYDPEIVGLDKALRNYDQLLSERDAERRARRRRR